MLELSYIFCIYSILGWVIEVVFFFVKTGRYHKRGILNGMYCPLYGFAMAVSTALLKNTESIFVQFCVCAVICVLFELITGIIFDRMLHHKMWDYTGIRGNIGGYICPAFAVIWGVLGVVAIQVINPVLLSTDRILVVISSVGIIGIMAFDLFINIIRQKNPDA